MVLLLMSKGAKHIQTQYISIQRNHMELKLTLKTLKDQTAILVTEINMFRAELGQTKAKE